MESRQILLYHTPDKALEAWRACVLAKMQQASLASWVEDMDADGGTLVVRWKTGIADPTLRHVTVTLHDGTSEGKSIVTFPTLQGDKRLNIKREAASKVVKGEVNGKAGDNGNLSSSFYLRAVPVDDQTSNNSFPTLVEFPAKKFNRNLNVQVGVLPYGSDVIHNAPPYGHAENMVEYDFFVPHSGRYDFQIEYAAGADLGRLKLLSHN